MTQLNPVIQSTVPWQTSSLLQETVRKLKWNQSNTKSSWKGHQSTEGDLLAGLLTILHATVDLLLPFISHRVLSVLLWILKIFLTFISECMGRNTKSL